MKKLTDYKGVIAFDFDATLATYSRPWRKYLLGEPIKEIIYVLRHYYVSGYYILIFTGRKNNKLLREWLEMNGVPYHSINTNPIHHEGTSKFKPYFQVLIDDKAINPTNLKSGKSKSTRKLIKEINQVINRGN